MELMRLTRRGLSLLILFFIASISLWFIKLSVSDKKNKSERIGNSASSLREEHGIKPMNGTISSYESLVFLIFIEGDVGKPIFEKVRATIGVSQLTKIILL